MDNMLDELTATDISQHFINDVTQDPNHNYDKLHDHVKALRELNYLYATTVRNFFS